MRTTIILDPDLHKKIRARVSPRKMSEFINACIRDFFSQETMSKFEEELAEGYRWSNQYHSDVADEMDAIAGEDWPEWA